MAVSTTSTSEATNGMLADRRGRHGPVLDRAMTEMLFAAIVIVVFLIVAYVLIWWGE